MRIGIAGVGGIGSNVAVYLARSGLTDLRIIDFDRVETTNLNRQYYFADQLGRYKVEALRENLRRIRAEVKVEALVQRIDRGNCQALFADCPVVVEGFDGAADKKMLVEMLGGDRLVVAACGIAGSDLTGLRVQRVGNCFIAGDFVTDCTKAPLFAHKVAAVAAQMTSLILQLGDSHGFCNP
jgi:sulfur carrier protein ThiS adenylyltransferase